VFEKIVGILSILFLLFFIFLLANKKIHDEKRNNKKLKDFSYYYAAEWNALSRLVLQIFMLPFILFFSNLESIYS